jgi:GNAT superfamily N-acetyltransferase
MRGRLAIVRVDTQRCGMEKSRKSPVGGQGESLRVRDVVAGDGPAIRPLLDQLGYALDVAEIERRIARVAGAAGHCLVMAEDEAGLPIALLHVYGRDALEKPPEAVVPALVVRDAIRGRGLGRAMMALAERWAAAQGYRHVALGSQTGRDGAHAFYRGLGYRLYGTSHQFRKDLPG